MVTRFGTRTRPFRHVVVVLLAVARGCPGDGACCFAGTRRSDSDLFGAASGMKDVIDGDWESETSTFSARVVISSPLMLQEWVPIIRHDIMTQRKMKAQPPLSDAYLHGMPAKRRKVTGSHRHRFHACVVVSSPPVKCVCVCVSPDRAEWGKPVVPL